MLLYAKGRVDGCGFHGQALLPPGPTREDVFHDAPSEAAVLLLRVEEPISWAVLFQSLDDEHISAGSEAGLFRHPEEGDWYGQGCWREPC